MDQHSQESYLLPSTSLVEAQDGLISLVPEGPLVQPIRPARSTRNVQNIQPMYGGSSMKGVPIFVKFEGSPNQNLLLPGQLVTNASDIVTQTGASLATSTHYIIQQSSSPHRSGQSAPTYLSVETFGRSQAQQDVSSLPGTKTTYIIQHADGISEGSTMLPVTDPLALGHGGLALTGIPLALTSSDTAEDMTITTSPSTSILPDNDTSSAESSLTLGQETLLVNQGGLVSVTTDLSGTEEDCTLGYVVDPKSFLNTDPEEKITDPKAFLNTTEKAAELKSFLEKSAADAATKSKEDAKEDEKDNNDDAVEEDYEAANIPPPKVFSSVTATLSESLLKAIPGSKDKFLKQVSKEHRVSLRHDITTDTFIITGETVKILDLEVSLNEMIGVESPDPPKPYRGILNEKNGNIQHVKDSGPEKADKGIVCHLLKPQYSRSGREVKWKTIEDLKSDEDDEMDQDSSDVENSDKKVNKMIRTTKKPARNKRKQPRPRKLGAKKGKAGKTAEQLPESLLLPKVEPTYTTILPHNDNSVIIKSASADGGDMDNQIQEVTLPIPKPRQLTMPKKVSEKTDSDSSKDNEKENRYRMGVMTDLELVSKSKPKKDYEALAPFKFFCNLCSFKTKRESHMKKHQDIHKKGLPLLKCTQCEYTTLRTTHLRRHEMEHSTEFYNCPICKYKSDSKKLLGRHYRVKHTGSQSGPPMAGHAVYSCECCDYKTTRRAQFERHSKCHADVNADGQSSKLVKSYMCTLCPYKTTKKEHFLRHNSNVHSERRPYLCDLCGKAFKRRDALKQHWLIHKDKSTRPYPFTCQQCHKGFRCQAHLNEHQTIHSNIRAYLCEICGASFKTRTVQRKHVQSIHKNPRSFACSQCNKRFNTRYGLRRHDKTHDINENKLEEDGVLQQDIQIQTGNDEHQMEFNQQQHIQIQIGDTNIIAELQPIHQEMLEDGIELKEDGQTIQTALIEESLEQDGEIHIPVRTFVQQEGATSEATTALLYLTNFAGIGN